MTESPFDQPPVTDAPVDESGDPVPDAVEDMEQSEVSPAAAGDTFEDLEQPAPLGSRQNPKPR